MMPKLFSRLAMLSVAASVLLTATTAMAQSRAYLLSDWQGNPTTPAFAEIVVIDTATGNQISLKHGDARADIPVIFGDQFAGAAYGITAELPPGVYDVVVYPHSVVTGDFRGAQIVRLTVR